VCISTVQRIFSVLKGEAELDQEVDEHSAYELPAIDPVEVSYSLAVPRTRSTSSSSTNATAPSTAFGVRSWSTSTLTWSA